jgi:hypothetical protein
MKSSDAILQTFQKIALEGQENERLVVVENEDDLNGITKIYHGNKFHLPVEC